MSDLSGSPHPTDEPDDIVRRWGDLIVRDVIAAGLDIVTIQEVTRHA